MTTWACAHCGQVCGDYAGGYGAIADARGTIRLCHPNDPARPDCYRRISIWNEAQGALIGIEPKPGGVSDIR